MKFVYHPCPATKMNSRKLQLKKKRFKLDNELVEQTKSFLMCMLYVFLLAMICSHNITTAACRQNIAIKQSINDSFLVCMMSFCTQFQSSCFGYGQCVICERPIIIVSAYVYIS